MKMLNALEDAKLGDSPAEAALLRESIGILLRALYPVAPAHHARAVERTGLRRRSTPSRSSMRRGRAPTRPRSSPTRSNWSCRSTASCARRSALHAAADKAAIEQAAVDDANVQKFVAGQPIKRVIVVPGKLVNVVV